MIKEFRFWGAETGPRLLIFGGIHGNEICGPEAIKQAVSGLESGGWRLEKGCVTLVPVCNPDGFRQGVRYVDKNLNRVFTRHDHPACYEEHLANVLVPLVEDCDFLLDLHSFHTPGPAYVFRDYDDSATRAFAAALGGPRFVLSGWPEMFAQLGDDQFLGDTVEYAHRNGKTGVVVECGAHTDPEAVPLALRCIENTLRFLGMLEGEPEKADLPVEVRFERIFFKGEGGNFVRDWGNLDPVKAGEVLALDGGGKPICAEKDGYVIMPNPAAKVGDEWFYLGVAVKERG